MAKRIAGAPGRNGLAEAERKRREWDERPIPWWDADAHAARREALGLPPLETPDD
jgi:hypothetical protein